MYLLHTYHIALCRLAPPCMHRFHLVAAIASYIDIIASHASNRFSRVSILARILTKYILHQYLAIIHMHALSWKIYSHAVYLLTIHSYMDCRLTKHK